MAPAVFDAFGRAMLEGYDALAADEHERTLKLMEESSNNAGGSDWRPTLLKL